MSRVIDWGETVGFFRIGLSHGLRGFLCAVAQSLDPIYDFERIWVCYAEAWPVIFDILRHF